MTEETKSILTNPDIIAIDQDLEAKPVQLLFQDGTSEVLVRPLTGNAVAIGLFNRGDKPAEVSFRWDSIHLFDNLGFGIRPPTVRDLWKHQEVPAAGDTFTATVPPHGVVMLQTINGGRRR